KVPNVQVKWPNDILSGEQKLCGILVENMVKGNQLNSAIIGIGLNVNQDLFPPGLNASSIKLLTAEEIVLEEVLKDLLGILDLQFEKYLHKSLESAIEAYEELLFRRGEEVKFRARTDEVFTGTILGIDTLGRLVVRDSQNTTAYGFNEIRMVI
ncbi:MAG: biotin--[acetyl-CoA-carboxylase] ligase, partial [Eudoraea sp.]|nr:biotin--[acetyl-CoA-carboxylase] ligase [Eudoraea sp.]